ncbi:MAG: ABC transporter permease [Eubacteriales bacterium]|nr:ABC transporter permease [Eubacteriales bacterium]
MQVFKAYLQIIRKNSGLLIMYLGIVVALAIMMSQLNQPNQQMGFVSSRVNIALVDRTTQSNHALINGLHDYLADKNTIVMIEDDNQALKDALFYGKIEYALIIPETFQNEFDQKNSAQLETMSNPGSMASIYLNMQVNKYLNTFKFYQMGYPNKSQIELAHLTLANLRLNTPVVVQNKPSIRGSYENVSYYFNYLAYALLSILIIGISTCMLTFNNLDLKRRNLCSPMTLKSMNLQLIAGNLVFSLFSWFVFIVISLLIYATKMFSINGLLYGLNSLCFMFVSLALSFLIGISLKNRNAQSAVSNVLALGMSFIAGVFVPQAIIGQTVLRFARLTPTYWYVLANNEIGTLTNLSKANLQVIFSAMGVQFVFIAIFFLVAGFVIYRKRQQN